jgi:NDP-sugar pyrophosphorylase family protein
MIPTDGPSCIVNDVYRPLIEMNRLGSYIHPGFWWEFGSPELYFQGCMKLLRAPREMLHAVLPQRDTIRKCSAAMAAVGPGVEIDKSAQLNGHIALGYGSFVSEEATIADSVVMPESWVGPRCMIERSIVAHGVEVPASFRAADEILTVDPGPDVELPPDVRRQAGMLRRPLKRAGG